MDTLNAKIGHFDATPRIRQDLKSLSVSPAGPPTVIPAGTARTFYDRTTDKYALGFATIQNVGIVKIYYAMGDNAAPNKSHGVIAPASGDLAGDGGSLIISDAEVTKLSLYADGGDAKVIVNIYSNTSRQNAGTYADL